MIRRAFLTLFPNLIRLPRSTVNIARIVAVALLFSFAASTIFTNPFFDRLLAADLSAVRAQRPPNCMEFIVNGGFEQTAVGWRSTAGASLFTYATDQYAGGQRSLLLGFTTPLNITTTFGVEQLITLPAESSAIEFSFYYHIEAEGEASPGDQAYLTMVDAENNQLLAMLVLSPTSSDSSSDSSNIVWSMGRYDLTPLAGKEIRLTFAIENDGEPGRIAMRVDDVSILACLPPENFTLEPLPTPTPTTAPPVAEPLQLLPVVSPTASSPLSPTVPAVSQAAPQQTPPAPQAQATSPQPGSVASLDACSCASSLYACADFSNWSIAQACYTHCQVTAGYDIHNLDTDRNGIACELEIQDVASLEATPSPQPTPSPITATTSITLGVAENVTESVTTPITITGAATLPVAAQGAQSSTITTTITSATTSTTTGTAAITLTTATSLSISPGEAVAVAPPPVEGETNTPTTVSTTSSSSLSPLEMLSLLLFSPLGFIAIGALLIVGALGLWVAYMLGQRGQAPKVKEKIATGQSTPEDFTLQPNNESSPPKS